MANLGRVTDELASNLQKALRAARKGQAVVLADSDLQHPAFRPVAHYSYLDVAVLLALWRRWELDALTGALAGTERSVPFGDVVASLVLHRCLDPGSKIEATRWYSRTALPELLGHSPQAFNNTRVHRALDQLAEVDEALQRGLAKVIRRERGGFRALFIDMTDTWFVGHGPDLAQSRKTKEGLWRLKIGIVLICSDEGLPLRWKVVEGRRAEQGVMLEAGSWLQQSGLSNGEPLVVDRAMGHVKTIADMKAADIRYLTALRSQAIEQFVGKHQAFELSDGIDVDSDHALTQLELAAERHDLTPAGDGLFGIALGVLKPSLSEHHAPSPHVERSQNALALAKALKMRLDDGHASTHKAAAEQLGLASSKASSLKKLLNLSPDIQQSVAAGRSQLSVTQLKELAVLPHREQQTRFELKTSGRSVKKIPDAASRVALFFHPQRFVTRRKEIIANRQLLDRQLDELNQRLATPQSRRNAASIEKEVRNKLLRPKGFEALLDIRIEEFVDDNGRQHKRVELDVNDAWTRTRRRDGFLVLAAHPDVVCELVTLAQLYSDRNTIEMGFRTIKSHLKLRPVFVHTDAKVRAHVSICMLGLLLRRSLELELDNCQTTSTTLRQLANVNLNRLDIAGAAKTGAYTLTQSNSEQLDILKKLNMEHLIDQPSLPNQLTAR